MKKYIYIIFIFLIFSNNILKSDDISDLTELADEGDVIAQNNLGHYYLYRSDNNSENLDKAIYYLNAAAAQGQVNAMTTVGWTYFTGDHGAPQDNEQAIYWNQKASDAGFTIASYNIGIRNHINHGSNTDIDSLFFLVLVFILVQITRRLRVRGAARLGGHGPQALGRDTHAGSQRALPALRW